MKIGQAIKTLRTGRRLTQHSLAESAGVSKGFLSLIEKGKREPDLDFVEKIASVLRIPPQLVLLLACERYPKGRRYARPLSAIARALDDLLRTYSSGK